MSVPPSSVSAYAALALTSLLWSGNTVVGRALHEDIPPAAFSFWRWVLVLVVLAPLVAAAVRRASPAIRREWRYLALLGVMSTGLYHALIFWVVNYTTAVNAALINSSIPFWVMLVGWVGLNARPAAREIVGFAVSVAGVAAILAHGDLARLAALQLNAGDLLMLVAMIIWALYTQLLARRPPPVSGLAYVFVTGCFGLVALAPVFALEAAFGRAFQWTPAVAAGVAYTGLFASVMATVLFTFGLARVGANITSLFTHLIPVFGAVLAYALLGEALGLHHLAGFVLILAGLAIAQGARIARRAPGAR